MFGFKSKKKIGQHKYSSDAIEIANVAATLIRQLGDAGWAGAPKTDEEALKAARGLLARADFYLAGWAYEDREDAVRMRDTWKAAGLDLKAERKRKGCPGILLR